MQRLFILLIVSIFLNCAGTKQPGNHVDENQIAQLKKSIRENPSDYNAFYKLGRFYADTGDTLMSIAYLDSSLAVRSNFLEAGFLKANLLLARDRVREAFEQFIAVLEQDTAEAFVKKVGGALGIVYPVRQLLKSRFDDANPVFSPSGNKIAFQSNRDNNWNIYTMSPSGGELERITKSQLNDEAPEFATDEKLFFTRQQSAAGIQRDIYVFDLAGKEETPVVVHPADDWYPVYEKSTGSLLFVSDREIEGKTNSKIFRLSNKELSALFPDAEEYGSPSVHPYKDILIFTIKQNQYYSLYQSNSDGSDIQPLSNRQNNFGGPKFSPDGNKIVFFSNMKNNIDIFELDLQSGEFMRLTRHPESDLSPDYSPDGKRIIFYSNRSGKYQIYELNLETPFTRTQLLDHLRLTVRENRFY